MPSIKQTTVAAAAVCAALALPAVASAKDYCVGGPAGCTGTTVAAAGLVDVLGQAATNGTDDRVFLGPGIYAADSFGHHSGDRVQIVGAGAGKTILRGSFDGSVLTLGGNPDSSVADLTLDPVGAATGGLTLQGTRAHRVTVDARSAPFQAGDHHAAVRQAAPERHTAQAQHEGPDQGT
jgi:hypothetical protein